jgi:hypothetical protein
VGLIMVLNDGETFSDLDGCAIVEVPDDALTERIEQLLAEKQGRKVYSFGPEGPTK